MTALIDVALSNCNVTEGNGEIIDSEGNAAS
jgi:predicted small secreted protein